MPEQDVKRWGPFSGRQLTIIIVALVAGVVLLPAAAFGVVKAKPFFITDDASGARVTAGKLKVDTGLAPAGTVPVSGAVSALPPTAQLWSNGYNAFFYSGDTVTTPPPGRALVITEMHITLYGGQQSGVSLLVADHQIGYWDFREPGTHDVSFATGVTVKSGDSVKFLAEAGATPKYVVTFFGYTVPAATCAAAGACGY
jgi:hypothetical protein